jgi:hypothetical protein
MSTSSTNDTSIREQFTKEEGTGISKKAIAFLAAVVVIGIFMVGFDQGEAFGITVPADGSGGSPGTNWAHEFYHDMRHAAGFACH